MNTANVVTNMFDTIVAIILFINSTIVAILVLVGFLAGALSGAEVRKCSHRG